MPHMPVVNRWLSRVVTLLAIVVVASLVTPPTAAATPSLSFYVHPVVAPRVSDLYGARRHPILKVTRHHDGVDLAAPYGSPIRAIAAGRVVFADPYGGYGKFIVVEHDKGLTSHYGHCSSIKVRPGQRVKAGQMIGLVGSTGRSTGAHLHLEIRIDGTAQDPMHFLKDLNAKAEG